MNFFTDPLLNKLRLIESGQYLSEGLTPEERKELNSLYKELAGWGGVDSEMDTLIAAYKKLPTGGGKTMAPVDPGTIALQKWVASKGYDIGKFGADGRWGPTTQKAIDAFWADWKAGKISEPDKQQYQKLISAAKDTDWTRYWFQKQKGGAAGQAAQPATTPVNPEAKKIRDRIAKLDPNLQMNKAYIAKLQAQADALEKGGGAAQPAEKRTPAEIQASADLKKAGV